MSKQLMDIENMWCMYQESEHNVDLLKLMRFGETIHYTMSCNKELANRFPGQLMMFIPPWVDFSKMPSASDIVGVQPMTAPTGEIYKLKMKYGEDV